MLRKVILLLLSVVFLLVAQQAANFTCKDMDGTSYTLYDILAEGKHVLIHQSGTW